MKKKRPPTEYDRALAELLSRVQQALQGARAGALPVRMYIAGGAALHLLTGARATEDVGATFSTRVLLKDDIEVAYRDADGRARLLYLDRNYNDTLGLLHDDAYEDAQKAPIDGLDRKVIDVRVLSPVDLAITKLARFTDQDREDVLLLARKGLIDARSLRRRAEQALGGYVGDVAAVRTSIDVACRLVEAEAPARRRKR